MNIKNRKVKVYKNTFDNKRQTACNRKQGAVDE